MKAVITTGGRIEGAYAAAAGTNIKALAEVRGATMLAHAVDALRGCGVQRIAVIAEPEVREAIHGRVDAIIDGCESGRTNLLRALRAWPEDDEPLLLLASDLPYINAPSLNDFIARSPHGTLTMPLTQYAHFIERFPGAPSFGITLGNERLVNGGVFSFPPGSIDRISAAAQELFDARKAPWRMAHLAGPGILLRFLLRRISVEDVEARARRIIGFPVAAVRNAAAELAFDADTECEYRYARAHW